MDLQLLNSGNPSTKTFLNIVSQSSYTAVNFSLPNYVNVIATPATLTPPDIVGSLINDIVGTGVINLPSATDISNYLATILDDGKVPDGFVFEVNMYKSSAAVVTVNLGANTATYGTAASITWSSANSSLNLNLKYRYIGGNYVVFYSSGAVP